MRALSIIAAGACLLPCLAPLIANADDTFLADAKGCKVYDPSPQPNKSVTWSGPCVDGYAQGSGVVQWLQGEKSGTRVKDAFVRGRIEGQGSTVSANGVRFEGNFHDGERSGKGIMTWPDGIRYEGDWRDGARTGAGVLTRPNGDRYEGDFVDGKWSGHGTFTSAAGERYTGDWVNGKREGKGEELWPSGNRYSGEGEPLEVQVLRSPPDKELMTKTMARILMLQKYTPASCKGVPCQMQYPIRFKFTLR